VVQQLKEVVGNKADEEIYAMLKECNMDLNETAQRLLNQGERMREMKALPCAVFAKAFLPRRQAKAFQDIYYSLWGLIFTFWPFCSSLPPSPFPTHTQTSISFLFIEEYICVCPPIVPLLAPRLLLSPFHRFSVFSFFNIFIKSPIWLSDSESNVILFFVSCDSFRRCKFLNVSIETVRKGLHCTLLNSRCVGHLLSLKLISSNRGLSP
jgi:hypothetical protein